MEDTLQKASEIIGDDHDMMAAIYENSMFNLDWILLVYDDWYVSTDKIVPFSQFPKDIYVNIYTHIYIYIHTHTHAV